MQMPGMASDPYPPPPHDNTQHATKESQEGRVGNTQKARKKEKKEKEGKKEERGLSAKLTALGA